MPDPTPQTIVQDFIATVQSISKADAATIAVFAQKHAVQIIAKSIQAKAGDATAATDLQYLQANMVSLAAAAGIDLEVAGYAAFNAGVQALVDKGAEIALKALATAGVAVLA